MASQRLESILRQVRAERKAAMTEVHKLDTIIQHLEELLNGPPTHPTPEPGRQVAAADRATRFAHMSAAKAAAIVLEEVGEPMHIDRIVVAIIDGGKKGSRTKLKANLNCNMRRQQDTFIKVGRGLFAHTKWRRPEQSSRPEQAKAPESQPPAPLLQEG